jgi:RHS repeat-associated protein
MRKGIFGTLLFLLLYCATLFCQAPSTAPSQPYENHGLYSIGLQDGSVVFNIPIRKKPGFNANFVGALDRVMAGPGIYLNATTVNWQAGAVVNGEIGNVATIFFGSEVAGLCPNGVTPTYIFSNWQFVDASGNVHPLPTADYIDNESMYGTGASCKQSTFTDQTTDFAYAVEISSSSTTASANVWSHNGGTFSVGLYSPTAGYTSGKVLSWKDSAGNVTSSNAVFTSYTDEMQGIAPLTSTGVGSTPPTFSWTDINGGTQNLTINTTNLIPQTSYGCASPHEDTPDNVQAIALFSGVTFPDTSTLAVAYEPNGSGKTTGRISSITLPTGGVIRFSYSGFNCSYLEPTTTTVTGANGTYTYAWAPAYYGGSLYDSTMTVTDPAGNYSVYTYAGLHSSAVYGVNPPTFLTEVQRFSKGSSTAGITTTICYNGNTINCLTTTPTLPLTSKTTETTVGGMSTSQKHVETYDKYGDILTSITYDLSGLYYNEVVNTFNATASCGAGSTIPEALCASESLYSGSEVSARTYTRNSAGYPLTINSYLPGNTTITTTNTYNANGTLATSTSPSGIVTTNTYGDCNGFGLTKTAISSTLYKSYTYGSVGCDGGVPVTTTDPNGNLTSYGYVASGGAPDPYYRLSTTTDPLLNAYANFYTPTHAISQLDFGTSTVRNTVEVDGYGRLSGVQKEEAPSSTLFDTTSYTYSQSSTPGSGAAYTSSVPCITGSLDTCTAGITTTQYDYLGRPLTITGGGGAVVTSTYNENDTEMVLSPAPSGENTKGIITENNGLRVTISCPIVTSTLPAGSGCGMAAIVGTGYPKTFGYTVSSGQRTYTTTLQLQTHTNVVDSLGRLVSETYPESGTTHYYYDAQSPDGCTTRNGLLTEKKDAKGNILCYTYDAYGRVSKVASNGTLCRLFFYDNSTGWSGGIPTGITVSNPYGHLVEATTSNCSTGLLVDEWFSYDALGRVTNAWESTTDSDWYFRASDTYFANGTVSTETLEGGVGSGTVVPYFTTTYTVDGEGRWSGAQIGSANTVTSTTYTAAQQPEAITYPLTGDVDSYVYSPTTGAMTRFTLASNGSTFAGSLYYNVNGTLNGLAITDGFNSGGTQSCLYLYDDLVRIANDTCTEGTGINQKIVYGSTMAYDAVGNITKSSSNGTAPVWPISGTYSATTNHLSSSAYDSNGSTVTDYYHTYTWDGFNKMLSLDSNSAMTYDAFGRLVQVDKSGTNYQSWYTPSGAKIQMDGSTMVVARLPMPGNTIADWTPAGIYLNHKDWMGNTRITTQAGTIYTDKSYGAYGEDTAQDFGGAGGDWNYGTMTQDLDTAVYDTPNREYMPLQSRWPNVDPAHASWNGYAYPSNPMSSIDPSGLDGNSPYYDGNSDVPFFSYDNDADAGSNDWNAYDAGNSGAWSTNTSDMSIWSLVGTGQGGGTTGQWGDTGFASGLVGIGVDNQMVMTSMTGNDYDNQSDQTRQNNSTSDQTTTVQVSPFGNTVMQVGGGVGTFGSGLSYVPSTGHFFYTFSRGTPGGSPLYAGWGPTTTLDQSRSSVTGSFFQGVGGALTVFPETGDTTQLFGFGIPGLASLSGGWTWNVGSVPPATFNMNITQAPPFGAMSTGDGLVIWEDY